VQIGVQLAQVGSLADPSALRRALVAAEQVGYDSVWVQDRLAGRVLDPLGVLAYAAAVTERVRLGASVLVAPWYRPRSLARHLVTVDRLSNGRVVVGLGLGRRAGDRDEPALPAGERARRLDSALDALDAERAARPRPPVLLAASTSEGFDRIARRADGWNPSGLPVAELAPRWADVRDRAAGWGRDPDALRLVVRANVTLTDASIDGARSSYAGSLEQVTEDLLATAAAGADEVILGLTGDPMLDEALDAYARLAEAIDRGPRVRR
jgi:alkanesulfonate monooxygenase SsuD/methylene tetrahydromethanopterin reductase-like flavin-dependent oxidoreductase (luciferase family)